MTKKFDNLVFIGRLQPFHKGHEEVIRLALDNSHHVTILIGSANRAITPRNPWTYAQRKQMVHSVFAKEMDMYGTIHIAPLNDYLYNDLAWMTSVRRIVNTTPSTITGDKVGIVGFAKDQSTYYLDIFPEWGSFKIENQHSTFNSTEIREHYFQAAPILPDRICAPRVVETLEEFMYTAGFKELVAQTKFLKAYAEERGPGPFVTGDAVVVQSGHILLVTRGKHPQKGMLAFPGGFLDLKKDSSLTACAIRELKEETKISDGKSRSGIPGAVLAGYITKQEVFDDPHRDERARIITQASLFELPNSYKMYSVEGADDAAKADWYPISDIKASDLAGDHYFIMSKLLGLAII